MNEDVRTFENNEELICHGWNLKNEPPVGVNACNQRSDRDIHTTLHGYSWESIEGPVGNDIGSRWHPRIDIGLHENP